MLRPGQGRDRRRLLGAICLCAGELALHGPARGAPLDEVPTLPEAPPAAMEEAPAAQPTPSGSRSLFVEAVMLDGAARGDIVAPLPPGQLTIRRQQRASVDLRDAVPLSPGFSLKFSDRLSLFRTTQDVAPFEHRRPRASVGNDLREVYIAWRGGDDTFVEAGRINLRNGVALGYNPTDAFKARSLVDQASVDPQDLGSDRLGAVMVRVNRVFSQGSVDVAYAPRLQRARALHVGAPPDLSARLGDTNSRDRWLVSGSFELADGVNPQLFLTRQDAGLLVGASASRNFGQRVVGYVEWMGGRQPTLQQRAAAFARETLPSLAPPEGMDPGGRRFRSSLVLGATVAGPDRMTFALEYHENQAGLSRAGWSRLFALAGPPGSSPAAAASLWFLRAYAANQQEPLSRREAFASWVWPRAFGQDIRLSGFAVRNLGDQSTFAQAAAAVDISDSWTLNLLLALNVGAPRSEYGSLPQQGRVSLQLRRYL